ncbi:MAG: 3-keto-disaccharide hydrolase [Planctomycetota bacterium]
MKGKSDMRLILVVMAGVMVIVGMGALSCEPVKCGKDKAKVSKCKAGWVSIFDGESFAGWEGDREIFRIEDGAIVGGSLEKKVVRNEFMCTMREYGDFELRVTFRLLGGDTNAGIQVRSRRIPNHHEMIGYQADMGQEYWGCLYDESRRKKVLAQANRQELDKVLRPGDWNEYVIRCEGRRVQLWINGYQAVDYTEADETLEQRGIIGLQIHSGGPGEAWYKDIKIKEL